MAKKVKFYRLWSTKEIIISIAIPVFILFLIGILTYHQELIDCYQRSKYDGVTIGKINNYQLLYGMEQSLLGNKPHVSKIKISFTYEVDGRTIKSERLIEGDKSNLKLMQKAVDGMKTEVKVLYQTQEPNNCIIQLEE